MVNYWMDENVVLTGVREMQNFQEQEAKIVAKEYGWKSPEEFGKISSVKDLENICRSQEDSNVFFPFGRGFVISDKNLNRFKWSSFVSTSVQYATDWIGIGDINFLAEIDEKQMLEVIRQKTTPAFSRETDIES